MRHGHDGLRESRNWGGVWWGEGEGDVLKDVGGVGVGKEGICSPFQFMFGSLCSTDHSNR